MRFLSTSTCCCCADLRTGGLIIGFLSLFGSVINLGLGTSGFLSCVVGLLIWGTWVYGIFNQRPAWMLPGLIATIAGLIVFILLLVLLPILGMAYSKEIQEALDDMAKKSGSEPINGSTILWILWIFLAIYTVIHWHITSVVYSLYKQMKENGQRSNAMYGA